MIYIIDTANITDIIHANTFYPLAGVTTNPTIISKENRPFWDVVKEIRDVIGSEKMLHVQTVQTSADKMEEEALKIYEELGENTIIKIPICEEGLKATMNLKKRGIGVTMTAIFTPAQALMAAQAGASFVAPYVNRLDNILADGTQVVKEIVQEFNQYHLSCKVLAASFKNAEQVHKCAMSGCDSVTISMEVFKSLISHPMTESAVNGFSKDWQSVYKDKTILDF